MPAIHATIAQALVLYCTALGLWGVFLGLRGAPLDASYRGALVLAVGMAVVEILIGGVLLLVLGLRARDDLHYLYGLSLIITLPLVHQYLAGRRMRAPLAYGLACLFMAGLAIRGITTGR
ncbi:MAG TPA: hypothetical protein VHN78_01995 [Chloroflexota bacterium]|nr:hypothetical protein [Chloroflexota bacterium]